MSKNFLSIHAKSFNWAGFFLPKTVYHTCSDLYDFCRTIDDIADQDLDLEIKKKRFEEFKKDFQNKNLETPIGISCRICPRINCQQRAFPPIDKDLKLDINYRGTSPYVTV